MDDVDTEIAPLLKLGAKGHEPLRNALSGGIERARPNGSGR
ncbi:hypothetical protein [Streptomyces sp. NPDC059909]